MHRYVRVRVFVRVLVCVQLHTQTVTPRVCVPLPSVNQPRRNRGRSGSAFVQERARRRKSRPSTQDPSSRPGRRRGRSRRGTSPLGPAVPSPPIGGGSPPIHWRSSRTLFPLACCLPPPYSRSLQRLWRRLLLV